MKVYQDRIKTRESKVPIWFLGDLHLGHGACDIKKFQKYREWALRCKARVILLGDLVELALPIHKPERGDIWHTELWPDQQVTTIQKLLAPLKGYVLIGCDGTHEERLLNITNMSPTSEICHGLNAQYATTWPFLYDLIVGDQTYRMVIGHGSGFSQNPEYQIKKVMNIYTDREIIALGHNHTLYDRPFTKLIAGPDGEEIEHLVWGIRTGAFLKYPDYARKHIYDPSRTGSAIMYLYTKKHIISVNTSGFPEYG